MYKIYLEKIGGHFDQHRQTRKEINCPAYWNAYYWDEWYLGHIIIQGMIRARDVQEIYHKGMYDQRKKVPGHMGQGHIDMALLYKL